MENAYYRMEFRQLRELASEVASLCDNPGIRLTAGETGMATRCLELAKSILQSGSSGSRHRISRAEEVLDKFFCLLQDCHAQERSVRFYADKLCLSPKYFSKLIRNASGRSAADWIDTYVIQEVKNCLKSTDLSIKQIVSRFNFADQPAFTKFFKMHTGMTPAQFRKCSWTHG